MDFSQYFIVNSLSIKYLMEKPFGVNPFAILIKDEKRVKVK